MKRTNIFGVEYIPKEWKIYKNKYLFEKKKFIVGDEFISYDLLSLTTKGIKKKDIDDNSGKLPESFSTYQKVDKDDLVLCLFDIDVSAVFSGKSPFNGMISPSYSIYRCIDTIIIPEYAEYWFKMIGYDRKYLFYSKSLRNTINADVFKEIYTAVPPINQQKAIVRYINSKIKDIDKIITETIKSILEYRNYRQSIVSEIVTRGIDTKRNMKDSNVEHIGSIPETWKVIRLKHILKERNIKSVTGTEEPLSMSQKFGLIRTKDMSVIPNMTSSYIGNKCVEINDLVFNKLKAHLGVFSVSSYNGIVSPDYSVYYSEEDINIKYLEYLFKTNIYISEFKKHSKGVGQGFMRLYTDELFNIKCALPPLEEQNKIVEQINKKYKEIDNIIIKKEELLVELEAYKNNFIYEYITGKREVK